MALEDNPQTANFRSLCASTWVLFILYWLALFLAAATIPFSLWGFAPLAFAGILSLVIGRGVKKRFALTEPSVWLCLLGGWIAAFFVLLAGMPHGGLEFGALVQSFYLFFFVPLATPILGTVIAGALQLLILFRFDLRLGIAAVTPFVSAAALFAATNYLRGHTPTYEELFVATFDAEGNYGNERILTREQRDEKHFTSRYTNFSTADDVIGSDADGLWILTLPENASDAGSYPQPTLSKYKVSDLATPLFSIRVDKIHAQSVRSIVPLQDGGAILLSSAGRNNATPYDTGTWRAQRYSASGEVQTKDPVALITNSQESVDGSGLSFLPVVTRNGTIYALYLTAPQSEQQRFTSATLRLKQYPDLSNQSVGWDLELGILKSPEERGPRLAPKGADGVSVVRHIKKQLTVLSYRADGSLEAEDVGAAANRNPLMQGAQVEPLRFSNSNAASGVFIFSVDDISVNRLIGVQRMRPDGTIDTSFAYTIKPQSCSKPCTNNFSNELPLFAVPTASDVFIVGNTTQTDRLYSNIDHDWWMGRISLEPAEDKGRSIKYSLSRHEGYERALHLGTDAQGAPFVVGRRKGIGWSSDSVLSILATALHKRIKRAVATKPADLVSRIPFPLDGSKAPADDFFPNPFLSTCSQERSFRRPLDPNPEDGPSNLRYRSNLDDSITFYWDCPADRPAPHIFEFDCCNCDPDAPEAERHGFENLREAEVTIKAEQGQEYLWHVSCGFSFAPISHDSVATLGEPGKIYFYKYYDFPADRTPEPKPTPWGGFNPDHDLDERVRRYQEKMRKAAAASQALPQSVEVDR